MDGVVIAYSGLGVVVLSNIAMFAYGYGKLSQKVEDLRHRSDRIEKRLNGIANDKGK